MPTDEQVINILNQVTRLQNETHEDVHALSVHEAYRLAVPINLGQSLDNNTAAVMIADGYTPVTEGVTL